MNEAVEASNVTVKINTKIQDYITPSMVICVIAMLAVVFLLRETVIVSFQTNVPLNSVIGLVILFATAKAFTNNLKLRQTAKYLKDLENLEGDYDIEPETIEKMADDLDTRGSLINLQNMYVALENLSLYGHLNFNDNDARLIKSKFGSRVRSDRGVVNYFAGILVMLGLIGTFWGLLLTIGAVGEAMGNVAQSFSAETAEAGAEAADSGVDLGEFIGSISKPLQGMGVAFSSSLFGLSGSLFLGFLNFFGGRAQNSTIEMISRWIDHRIPQMNPVLAEKVKKQKVPEANDLKAWLAGFVYLSSKTNQKMGQIMLALSKSTQAQLKSAYQTEKLYDYQKDIYLSMEKMSTRMSYIKDSIQYLTKNVDPAMNHNANMRSTLVQIKDIMASSAESNDNVTEKQLTQMSALTNQIREFNSTFEVMGQIQSSLVKEIEKLREKTQREDNISEFTNLVWQLNTIMEEIKQKNVSAYMNIFDSEGDANDDQANDQEEAS